MPGNLQRGDPLRDLDVDLAVQIDEAAVVVFQPALQFWQSELQQAGEFCKLGRIGINVVRDGPDGPRRHR